MENNRANLKNITFEAERTLIPFKAKVEELESRVSREISKNNELTNNLSGKDQKIGQLQQQIDDKEKAVRNLETQLTEKGTRLDALTSEIENLKNHITNNDQPTGRVQLPTSKTPNTSSDETNERILKSYNLPPGMIKNIRDYAEENEFSHAHVIEQYKHAIGTVVQSIANKNQNSKKISNLLNPFKQQLTAGGFTLCDNYLNEMLLAKSLTPAEIAALNLARILLNKLAQYLI